MIWTWSKNYTPDRSPTFKKKSKNEKNKHQYVLCQQFFIRNCSLTFKKKKTGIFILIRIAILFTYSWKKFTISSITETPRDPRRPIQLDVQIPNIPSYIRN